MRPLDLIRAILRVLVANRAALIAESLALRQRDRIFWVWLSKLWRGWRSALVVVQPDTVVRWHRRGLRLYWRWQSNTKGPPKIEPAVRGLVRRISRENPLWGAPHIQAELALLGHAVAESTVAKSMVRNRPNRPPPPTWRSFLANHMDRAAACDFFVVPTATFRLVYCFVILAHGRRRILHVNITDHPTAQWTAQPIVEAFPADGSEPRYLLRDRDSIYGDDFPHRLENSGSGEVLIALRSPWQSPYAERVIGTLRRERVDHLIVLSESHLRRILRAYVKYYNGSRCHGSLAGNPPLGRETEPPSASRVTAIPHVRGLHHRYTRAA